MKLKKLLTLNLIFVLLLASINVFAQEKVLFNKEVINGQTSRVIAPRSILVDSKTYGLQKNANMDTLLFVDFDTLDEVPDFNNGGNWLNLSYDTLSPDNPNLPTDFFLYDSVAIQDITTGDTIEFTTLLASTSWMAGLAIGNRNAMMSPLLTITQPGATLSFNAMPQQGPQWADGFTIKVDLIGDPQSNLADTLIQVKQYGGSGDGPVTDPSFNWGAVSGDTMHTIYNYDPTLATFTDSGNTTVSWEYYEFSLDAYIGQSIYITFYHDSDDDNAIWFDNILVMQPLASGLNTTNEQFAKLYPNPAKNSFTFESNFYNGAWREIKIFDLSGELVSQTQVTFDGFGVQKTRINTEKLKSGFYIVQYFDGKGFLKEKLIIE